MRQDEVVQTGRRPETVGAGRAGPAPGQPVVLRRVWVAALLAVPLAVAVELVVGLATARSAASLGGTYLYVVVVGVGVPAVVVGAVVAFEHRRAVEIDSEVHLLVVVAVLCGVFGFVWVNRARRSTFVVEAVVFGAYLLWWLVAVRRGRSLLPPEGPDRSLRSRSDVWVPRARRVIALLLAGGAGSLAFMAAPDPLTLHYRWDVEAAANRFVPQAAVLEAKSSDLSNGCYSGLGLPVLPDFGRISELCPGRPGFALDNNAGWSLGYHTTGNGICARHLDGPWWESFGGTEIPQGAGDCPAGLTLLNLPSP